MKVVLHVYDLSGGMARQFSPMLLGQTIEGIWHTGIYVYGKEYFYGGGIQRMLPGEVIQTYGRRPQHEIELGTTDISKEVFEQFLTEVSPQYTMQTYDLINHNCNNFSNAVSNFLIGENIPDWILNLPEQCLSTPFGQMIRPMLEQMQNAVANPFSAGVSEQPSFVSAATPTLTPKVTLKDTISPIKPILSQSRATLKVFLGRLCSGLDFDKIGSKLKQSPEGAKICWEVASTECARSDWAPTDVVLQTLSLFMKGILGYEEDSMPYPNKKIPILMSAISGILQCHCDESDAWNEFLGIFCELVVKGIEGINRSIILVALANALGSSSCEIMMRHLFCSDICIGDLVSEDLHSPDVSLRRASAALTLNISLALQNEDESDLSSEAITSLLVTIAPLLSEEELDEKVLDRLVKALGILVSQNEIAKELVDDLAVMDSLKTVSLADDAKRIVEALSNEE
eukprot:TRINITY_DN6157_c0_g1_i1.p1 TRINITY_DN6157_c0_g1~~TRINITY_DN6157_c0_g1_i1.p1  ORF type:complete len:457 (+),score=131.71 TRINITY_DN6157_c0_g1_i1:109-1479(+)